MRGPFGTRAGVQGAWGSCEARLWVVEEGFTYCTAGHNVMTRVTAGTAHIVR